MVKCHMENVSGDVKHIIKNESVLGLHSGESKGDWVGDTSARDTAGYRRLVGTRPVATILLLWALRQDGERGSLHFFVGGGWVGRGGVLVRDGWRYCCCCCCCCSCHRG